MFGLAHCIHFACLMNGSNHLAESDSQPLHLCPVCLRKLHQSVGFDLLERYRQLHGISQKLGLTDAASWYKARLQSLESVPQ
jgi:archaemetzincin